MRGGMFTILLHKVCNAEMYCVFMYVEQSKHGCGCGQCPCIMIISVTTTCSKKHTVSSFMYNKNVVTPPIHAHTLTKRLLEL